MANPKDLAGKALNLVHRNLYRWSGGKLGGRGYGMPVVILTTIGRKTGQPRPTVLTSPIQDGDTVVLVASWGGDDRHPLWYRNLLADPNVELEIHGKKREMTARVVTPDEKAELWPRVVAAHKGYASYQEKTDREIPLVILDPRT